MENIGWSADTMMHMPTWTRLRYKNKDVTWWECTGARTWCGDDVDWNGMHCSWSAHCSTFWRLKAPKSSTGRIFRVYDHLCCSPLPCKKLLE